MAPPELSDFDFDSFMKDVMSDELLGPLIDVINRRRECVAKLSSFKDRLEKYLDDLKKQKIDPFTPENKIRGTVLRGMVARLQKKNESYEADLMKLFKQLMKSSKKSKKEAKGPKAEENLMKDIAIIDNLRKIIDKFNNEIEAATKDLESIM